MSRSHPRPRRTRSLASTLTPAVRLKVFYEMLRQSRLVLPVPEFRFDPDGRRWRFDFAWPATKVALEVDGGIWTKGGGRHTRGSGWLKDTEKLNRAAVLGWRMLRCTPSTLCDPMTIATIAECLTDASRADSVLAVDKAAQPLTSRSIP